MKTILISLWTILLVSLVSCASNNISEAEFQKTKNILDSGDFIFMAQKAMPTNIDVVNVMNSFPNAAANNLRNLDYGYYFSVKKDELKSELPYFGRRFVADMNTESNGIRFISKDFFVSKKSGKKNSTVFLYEPKDTKYINRLVLEIYSNGKAYLSIDSNDRQPIYFDGYVTYPALVK